MTYEEIKVGVVFAWSGCGCIARYVREDGPHDVIVEIMVNCASCSMPVDEARKTPWSFRDSKYDDCVGAIDHLLTALEGLHVEP